MADRITIQCPACRAKLSVSDASKIGKKIRCSKCSEIFVAKAAGSPRKKPMPPKAAASEFDLSDAEMDDFSEGGYEEMRTTSLPGRSGATTRHSTSKGRTGNNKPLGSKLLAGVGVASVLLLLSGVGVYFLFFRDSGANPELPSNQPVTVQTDTTPSSSGLETDPSGTSETASSPPNAGQQASAIAKPQAAVSEADKYGEMTEVSASNTDELPEGTRELTARTRWIGTKGEGIDVNGNSVPVIELVLDIQGDALPKAFAFGRANIKTIQMAPGQEIAVFNSFQRDNWSNPLRRFVPYAPTTSHGPYEHSEGHLRIVIPLLVPDTLPSTLALVKGDFWIRTGNSIEEIALPDVRIVANKPFENSSLRAAGGELLIRSEKFNGQNTEAAYFRLGSKNGVGPLFMNSSMGVINVRPDYKLDPNGNSFSTFESVSLPVGPLKMDIRLYSDLRDILVPFHFDNVPLPDISMKPK